MVDLDIGEIVLNFMLDLDAQTYVVVDVTNMPPEEMYENKRVLLIYWYRRAIELKPPTNHTTQAILFEKIFVSKS